MDTEKCQKVNCKVTDHSHDPKSKALKWTQKCHQKQDKSQERRPRKPTKTNFLQIYI